MKALYDDVDIVERSRLNDIVTHEDMAECDLDWKRYRCHLYALAWRLRKKLSGSLKGPLTTRSLFCFISWRSDTANVMDLAKSVRVWPLALRRSLNRKKLS